MDKHESPGQRDLKPCPFCGGAAEFERVGTNRQSCIVACTDCGCRLATGETWNSGAAWNERAPDAAAEERVKALEAAIERVRPVVEALASACDCSGIGGSGLPIDMHDLLLGMGRPDPLEANAAWLRSLLPTAGAQ